MADMEDTQNSAPGHLTAHEATKLGSSSRRQDTQSVTKRYILPRPCNIHRCRAGSPCRGISSLIPHQIANRAHADYVLRYRWCLSFPFVSRKPSQVERYNRWPCRHSIREPNLQALLSISPHIPLRSPRSPFQDTDISSQC